MEWLVTMILGGVGVAAVVGLIVLAYTLATARYGKEDADGFHIVGGPR